MCLLTSSIEILKGIADRAIQNGLWNKSNFCLQTSFPASLIYCRLCCSTSSSEKGGSISSKYYKSNNDQYTVTKLKRRVQSGPENILTTFAPDCSISCKPFWWRRRWCSEVVMETFRITNLLKAIILLSFLYELSRYWA